MFASSPLFQTYLLPALSFRRRSSGGASRRHSSIDSNASYLSSQPTSPSSPTSSLPSAYQPPASDAPTSSYLADATRARITCSRCHADLAFTSQIVSKGFVGRHGRAFLVAPPDSATASMPNLPNIQVHRPVSRALVTGMHIVSDISCACCGNVLGWKYMGADEESQRYKVGKVILETRRTVVESCWEDDDAAGAAADDDDAWSFDSANEDECEDLFSGVWTAQRARAARMARRRRGAA